MPLRSRRARRVAAAIPRAASDPRHAVGEECDSPSCSAALPIRVLCRLLLRRPARRVEADGSAVSRRGRLKRGHSQCGDRACWRTPSAERNFAQSQSWSNAGVRVSAPLPGCYVLEEIDGRLSNSRAEVVWWPRCRRPRSVVLHLRRSWTIIRFAHDVELRRDRRVANPPEFYFKAKEIEALIGDLVQPIQRGPVFLSKALRNPYDGDRTEPSAYVSS
jgi:hypothetical protein